MEVETGAEFEIALCHLNWGNIGWGLRDRSQTSTPLYSSDLSQNSCGKMSMDYARWRDLSSTLGNFLTILPTNVARDLLNYGWNLLQNCNRYERFKMINDLTTGRKYESQTLQKCHYPSCPVMLYPPVTTSFLDGPWAVQVVCLKGLSFANKIDSINVLTLCWVSLLIVSLDYRVRLKGWPQVWWNLMMLFLTPSAYPCLKHSRYPGTTF